MADLDLLAPLEPEDSPELWDSPDPRELLVMPASLAREDLLVLLDPLALLAKMVTLALLDLRALLDQLVRRERADPLDLQDSRDFPDPKVLLVRLASPVSRV